jgi:PAS domain S-box-containing protein
MEHIPRTTRIFRAIITPRPIPYRFTFILAALAGSLTLALLALLGQQHYPFFHGFAESFAIVIASAIFMVAWHTRGIADTSYLLFLGIAYLHVGFLNFLHLMTGDSVPLISGPGTLTEDLLFLLARLTESTALLLTPFFVTRRIRPALTMACFLVPMAGGLAVIFLTDITTPALQQSASAGFIAGFHALASAMLVGALIHIHKKRKLFHRDIHRLLALSIALMLLSELVFAFSWPNLGLLSVLEHLLKVLSYFCIYRAVLVTHLEKPYGTLFRELESSKAALEQARDHLEAKVIERTAELEQTNRHLLEEIATRKDREKELRASRERFRLIAETIDDAFWITTPGLQEVVYMSPACVKIWGLSEDAFQDWPWSISKLVHPDDLTAVLEARQKPNHPWAIEYRIVRPDTTVRWIRERGFPVGDEGEQQWMVGTANDITENVALREALRQHRDKLEEQVNQRTTELRNANRELALRELEVRTLAENAPDIICRHNRKLAFVFASPSVESLMGLTPQECLDHRFDELGLTRRDAETLNDVLKAALKNREPTTCELQLQLPQGRRHLEWKAVPERTPEGNIETILSIARDITERVAIQEQLRKSEKEFRSFFQLSGVGKAQCDPYTRQFLRVNKRFCEMTGYEETELLGMTEDLITHPEDRIYDQQQAASALGKADKGWYCEKRYLTKAGKTVWVAETGTVLRNSEGSPIRTMADIRDMTLQKQTEEAIADIANLSDENPLPVLRLTREGTILFANEASRNLLSQWNCSTGEKIPAQWRGEIQRVYLSGQSDTIELRHAERIFWLTIVPVVKRSYINIYGIDVTEQITAKQQLEDSEQRYESIVQASMEGVWAIDPTGTIAYANDRAAELAGYSSTEQLMGRQAEDFFGSTAAGFFTENDEDANAIREQSLQCCDGSSKWVLVSRRPFRDGSGRIIGTMALTTDISLQKHIDRLDQALTLLSMELFSGKSNQIILERVLEEATQALEAGSSMVIMRSGEYWEVSHSWGELPPDVLGSSFTDSDIPLGVRAVRTATSVATEDTHRDRSIGAHIVREFGIRSVLSMPIILHDGPVGVLFFNYHDRPVSLGRYQIDFANKLSASLSLALENARLFEELRTELSERRRVELDLHRAREQLENLVARQQDTIVETRQSLSYETAQRHQVEQALTHRQQALEAVYAMATAFGSSIESLFDQIILSVSGILKVPFAAIGEFQTAGAGRISEIYNGRLFRQGNLPYSLCPEALLSGRRRTYQQSGSLEGLLPEEAGVLGSEFRCYVAVPVLDDVGDVRGVICAMDRFERTFSQYEIHLIEIFARYVGHEISRGRLEEKLRHSQQMELLGHLTSGVAHEVRNPLNAIMAIVEALWQEIGENDEYDQYLKHLRNQVTRLAQLMEDLLTLGRPISRTTMYRLSIKNLLDESITAWQQAGQNKKRSIRIILPGEAEKWQVRADGTKLQQVIVNLLENASQHSTEDDEVQVVLQAESKEKVAIRVVDNGKGIPLETLPRIFEPFYTTRKAGTGLGLSIVRHIVESHQGCITITNNHPAPGVTAEVILPLFSVPAISSAISS